MTYVVNNNAVYFNALSGAFAGMGASGKVPTDGNPADYATLVAVGTAFAQSFDQLIPPTFGIPSIFDELISGLCSSVWENRSPQGTPEDLDPATYTPICQALIAMVVAYASTPVTPQPFISNTSTVVWRPDGQGDVTTWAEVMAVVTANRGPTIIYVPQQTTYAIDPGPADPAVIWDMKGSRFVAPNGPHDSRMVQIRRNATLFNLWGIVGGMRLQASKLAGDPPALTFQSDTPGGTCTFVVDQGAELHSLGISTDVMLTVPPTGTMPEFYLVFNELGTCQADGPYPVVGAGPGSILNVVALSGGLSLDTVQPPNWLGGDASAVVNWIHDGTMAFPPVGFWDNSGAGYFPNLLSTLVNQPTGCVGGTGPLANRPTFQLGGPPSLGCMYFATDYAVIAPSGSPIFWDGANWRDTAGTIVP